ncbi:MAG: hypothetical protein Q8Q09_09455 [Deltaproteobacteria bacterium]|nr:hypothetical protein [Deltaproteobacteria bacterium]
MSDAAIEDATDAMIDAPAVSCAGQAFGASCAPGLICDGRGACAIRRPCRIETGGRWLYPQGATRRLLETIFAYGRYSNRWINADGTFEVLGDGVTHEVARWRGADNPCGTREPCRMGSFNLLDSSAGGVRTLIESTVAYGVYYTFDVTSTPMLVTRSALDAVARYSAAMSGPCEGQPAGMCEFATRSIEHDWSTSMTLREVITAGGRRWVFDGGGRPLLSVMQGQRLQEIQRYNPSDGRGPCVGRDPCVFDAQWHDPTTRDEFVVAYGRLWVWANDAENTRRYAEGYGNELHTFARYAEGACRVSP